MKAAVLSHRAVGHRKDDVVPAGAKRIRDECIELEAHDTMAVRVLEQGVETILHVCGRDRNLLATLAHLLAAHELGVRNVVIITGDPPKMGDFPDASAVYDLDSIGILKLATRLNHGIDPGGKPLGSGTRFVLATGAEPAALNYERELTRLRQKKEAGA